MIPDPKFIVFEMITDILNIDNLFTNSLYKFTFYDFIDLQNMPQTEEYVCIKITPTSVEFNEYTKFFLKDEKENLIPFLQIFYKNFSAGIFINKGCLHEINKVTINIQTPENEFTHKISLN